MNLHYLYCIVRNILRQNIEKKIGLFNVKNKHSFFSSYNYEN